MIPSFIIESLLGSLFVLEITEHHVHTSCQYFTWNLVWVGRVNLNLHIHNGLSARARHMIVPVVVGNDRSTLSCTIADGEW